jgi:hypothetical protein
LTAAQATTTMHGYTNRESYAAFGISILEDWRDGLLDDEDFRKRLASLAVAPVGEDAS